MNKKSVRISFDVDELIHLRDLFSVMFEDGSSVSERLSLLLKREKIEISLWQKIYKECENLKISVDKDAPNFLITPTEINLDVFNAKILYEDASDKVEEQGKINDEKSKSRSKNLSSSQDKDKNNTMSNNRRSNKKNVKR
jgi:hypothetical protein